MQSARGKARDLDTEANPNDHSAVFYGELWRDETFGLGAPSIAL